MAKSLFQVRTNFKFPSKETINYFPWHMQKGIKKLITRLKDVDCVIEVHDARLPFSGRNPIFKDTAQVRPHLLILNKTDLADTSQRNLISRQLEQHDVNSVLFTSLKSDTKTLVKKEILPTVYNLVNHTSRYNRSEEDSINILITGIPNVGKSSIINALRNVQLGLGGKASRTGPVAGVTRSVLEKIRISNDPKTYVYDTPGILQPKIPNIEVGMKLALCGTLQDHLIGKENIVDYLLYWLNRNEMFDYVDYFQLPKPTDDVVEFLSFIALKKNLMCKIKSVTTGKYESKPNFDQVAEIVLKAFRNGELCKVNLDNDIQMKNFY